MFKRPICHGGIPDMAVVLVTGSDVVGATVVFGATVVSLGCSVVDVVVVDVVVVEEVELVVESDISTTGSCRGSKRSTGSTGSRTVVMMLMSARPTSPWPASADDVQEAARTTTAKAATPDRLDPSM
ncbi:MAG: hypothetical protein GY925_03660 [Actinomycetia bacterium]|nr:hypothetical protein [Actinomycetes bacterium]